MRNFSFQQAAADWTASIISTTKKTRNHINVNAEKQIKSKVSLMFCCLKDEAPITSLTVDNQLDLFVCRSQDVCRLTLVHSRVIHLRVLNFQLTTKHC